MKKSNNHRINKKRVLITGGTGFVGTHLVERLLDKGNYEIVVFDKLQPDISSKYYSSTAFFKGDILSKKDISDVFKKKGPFIDVFHLASAMPDKAVSNELLWQTNVEGSRNIVAEAVRDGVKSFVFTSSNVIYGIPLELPITEFTPPNPLEIYGKSKIQAEKELEKFKNKINIQIFRCPVITGIGRLGLQSILYEFISENKKVYVLGNGLNKYQFVDVMDVVSALEKSSNMRGFDTYLIGADEVLTLKEIYEKVINFANSKSRIISLPSAPALIALAILDKLNISPLGVYQYSMIGRSIYADTSKIKKRLGWKPKKTNVDTFIDNYKWYIENKGKFSKMGSGSMSSNKSLPRMGVLRLLKLIS